MIAWFCDCFKGTVLAKFDQTFALSWASLVAELTLESPVDCKIQSAPGMTKLEQMGQHLGQNSWAPKENLWGESRKRLRVPTVHQGGFPGGTGGKEFTCQCRRHRRYGLGPWVGKISWHGKRHPTPILAWIIPWTEESGSLQSVGLQRVRCKWAA